MTSVTETVLTVARNAIVHTGWCQLRDLRRVDGEVVEYCALGAIYVAASVFSRADRIEAVRRLAGTLTGRNIGSALGGQAIVDWNDEPGRTPQEVIDLFDKAIIDVQGTA